MEKLKSAKVKAENNQYKLNHDEAHKLTIFHQVEKQLKPAIKIFLKVKRYNVLQVITEC